MPNALLRPAVKPPPVFSLSPPLYDLGSASSVDADRGVTSAELQTLVRQISVGNSTDVVRIACLFHLTRKAFAAYALSAKISLAETLELHYGQFVEHLALKNIPLESITSVLAGLERAEVTIRYLDT